MEPRPSEKDIKHIKIPTSQGDKSIAMLLDYLAQIVGWEEIFSYVHEKTYQTRIRIESMNMTFESKNKKRD